jgi:hypothetical protein
MSRVKTVACIGILVLLVALALPAVAVACPDCKEAKADGEYPGGSASLGLGFYYSILLMIAVPWTAVSTIAFLIYRKQRRLKVQASGAQP